VARKRNNRVRCPEDLVKATRERARIKRRAIGLCFLAVLLSLIIFAISGEGGAITLYMRWQEKNALAREVVDLQAANTKKKLRNQALETDPHAVERIAREELDLMRPGEVMIVLPEPEKAPEKR